MLLVWAVVAALWARPRNGLKIAGRAKNFWLVHSNLVIIIIIIAVVVIIKMLQ